MSATRRQKCDIRVLSSILTCVVVIGYCAAAVAIAGSTSACYKVVEEMGSCCGHLNIGEPQPHPPGKPACSEQTVGMICPSVIASDPVIVVYAVVEPSVNGHHPLTYQGTKKCEWHNRVYVKNAVTGVYECQINNPGSAHCSTYTLGAQGCVGQ